MSFREASLVFAVPEFIESILDVIVGGPDAFGEGGFSFREISVALYLALGGSFEAGVGGARASTNTTEEIVVLMGGCSGSSSGDLSFLGYVGVSTPMYVL